MQLCCSKYKGIKYWNGPLESLHTFNLGEQLFVPNCPAFAAKALDPSALGQQMQGRLPYPCLDSPRSPSAVQLQATILTPVTVWMARESTGTCLPVSFSLTWSLPAASVARVGVPLLFWPVNTAGGIWSEGVWFRLTAPARRNVFCPPFACRPPALFHSSKHFNDICSQAFSSGSRSSGACLPLSEGCRERQRREME